MNRVFSAIVLAKRSLNLRITPVWSRTENKNVPLPIVIMGKTKTNNKIGATNNNSEEALE